MGGRLPLRSRAHHGGGAGMSDKLFEGSGVTIHSFVCPHCGKEIFPPEGKSLIMRDLKKMRDAMNTKRYWKKVGAP